MVEDHPPKILKKLKMPCTLSLSIKIITLICSAYAIVSAIVIWAKQEFTYDVFIQGFVNVFFAIILIMSELYFIPFFKYFTLVFTTWGKSIIFFILGITFYSLNQFNSISSILFWCMSVMFSIFSFIGAARNTKPFFQKSNISFSVSSTDIFTTPSK